MNIGQLIDWLSKIPETHELRGLEKPHSYRGYYYELAFEPTNKFMTSKELLELVKGTVGQTYEGYKGGMFKMYKDTNVYLAKWGSTGKPLSETYFYPYDIALVHQYFEEMQAEKDKFHAWLRFRGGDRQ